MSDASGLSTIRRAPRGEEPFVTARGVFSRLVLLRTSVRESFTAGAAS